MSLKSFVSDNRRAALARYFRQYYGTFANVQLALLKKEADENVLDEKFEAIEKQVRYVLQQILALETAAHQAVLAPLASTFDAVRTAYDNKVPRAVEQAHFAKAIPLKTAVDEAKRNLEAFEADVADLKASEARLLLKTGGERPVRKVA